MDGVKAVLGITDYIIFASMLVVSAGIGVYFRFAGGKQKTTDEFLLAGKDMAILPVAFSLMASFLSAITVIGVPAEMYKFGVHLAFMNVGFVVGMFLSSYLFLPVFFKMQSSTAYEYLERRFGKTLRIMSSVAFVAQMILYMSVVLYAPALALSAVTNLSTWVSVVSIGVVCTFYCTIGGMKAVLWTDVFQAILMYLCLFAVLIKGSMDIGGLGNAFRIANEGGRLALPGFELDPSVRYTAWNIFLQGVVLSMSAFGGNQVQIQRMLTVKTISRSRAALYWSIPMGVGFHLMNCLAGIIIYANFASCDPMTSEKKPISSADQLLPYYVMQSLGKFPGLPGLCICGIFSASLSTVSSAVNSLSAVTMEDLVKPLLTIRGISQAKAALTAKAISVFYGILCVLLTFLVARFGNLIQASLTVFGMLGGPVLGIFFLGMLTTRTNKKGAIIGLITSIMFAAWISFGASSYGPAPTFLPVSTEGCLSTLQNGTAYLPQLPSNTTSFSKDGLIEFTIISKSAFNETNHEHRVNELNDNLEDNNSYIFPLYRISYMWFAVIGFGTTVIIGYISSILIKIVTVGEKSEVSRENVSPLLRWFMKDEEKPNQKGISLKEVKALESSMCPTQVNGDKKQKY